LEAGSRLNQHQIMLEIFPHDVNAKINKNSGTRSYIVMAHSLLTDGQAIWRIGHAAVPVLPLLSLNCTMTSRISDGQRSSALDHTAQSLSFFKHHLLTLTSAACSMGLVIDSSMRRLRHPNPPRTNGSRARWGKKQRDSFLVLIRRVAAEGRLESETRNTSITTHIAKLPPNMHIGP
jgi:hypothetical protein